MSVVNGLPIDASAFGTLPLQLAFVVGVLPILNDIAGPIVVRLWHEQFGSFEADLIARDSGFAGDILLLQQVHQRGDIFRGKAGDNFHNDARSTNILPAERGTRTEIAYR